jgi:hypothetical protein
MSLPLQSSKQSKALFQGKELYVLLSDLCNFSCAHCLNSSGPKAKRWYPTDDSLDVLASEINGAPQIEMLNFTGGEPSLFLPQIRKLLERIHRKIAMVITTNGWFADRSVSYLDELPLQAVVISHDRFHTPFISLEKLVPLVRHYQARGINVSFNFVFDDIQELAYLSKIQELGVTVHTSKLIDSGRGSAESAWKDTSVIHQTCPSLVPDQRRTPDLEKVIYISQEGFTACCGPLVFDELTPQGFAFSPSMSEYSEQPLIKAISSGTFAEQAKQVGLDLSALDFKSACDPCALLYGQVAPGLPSIAEICQREDETIYLPLSGFLEKRRENALLQKYIVGYTQTIDPKKLKDVTNGLESSAGGVNASALTREDRDAVIEFVKANYYSLFTNHYNQAMVNEFSRFAPIYLDWPSVQGTVYRKYGKIVGVIFTNRYDPHPALKDDTLHIGYWGYDRDALLKSEARWIKYHWLQCLQRWSGDNRFIDATFDAFNSSSLGFARSLGFEPKMMRLSRKVK